MAIQVAGLYGSSPYGASYYGGFGNQQTPVEKRVYFLVNNLLESFSSVHLSASSTAAGFYGNIKRNTVGFGTISVQGSYTGLVERVIQLRIMSLGPTGETEVGVTKTSNPKFQVSLDNGVTWDTNGGSFYFTSLDGSDNPQSLTEKGTTIFWVNVLSGISFQVNDTFSFSANNSYSINNIANWDGYTGWKAQSDKVGEPVVIDVDLGISTAEVNSIGMTGLNFIEGSGATIQIQASISPYYLWGNGATIGEDVTCPYTNSGNAGYVFMTGSVSYRYWRVTLTPTVSVLPQLTHLFLGRALQLSRDIQNMYTYTSKSTERVSRFGTGSSVSSIQGNNKYFSSSFKLLTEIDKAKVLTLWETVHEIGKPLRPFYFIDLPTAPENFLFSVFDQQDLNLSNQNRKYFSWGIKLRQAF